MFSSRLLRLPPALSRRCLSGLSYRRRPCVPVVPIKTASTPTYSRRFASTNSSSDASSAASTKESQSVVEPSPVASVLDASPKDTPYYGPLTITFRRLKAFSLTSLTLTFALTPFIFVIETTSNLPVVGRFVLAGVAMATSGVSTALVAWCGRPYVTTLRWLDPEGDSEGTHSTGSPRGLEMTTMTLALNERITRVYDTAFLVPASRPFATWELAHSFQLSSEETAIAKRQGALPREETIAETMTSKGDVIGRWIVKWDENGAGTCTEVGKVVRHFNVHQELLDRPIR